MSEELEEIFRSETKGIEKTTGVLSRLVRKVFIDLNIKSNQWQIKMNRYLASKHCDIPIDDISRRSSFKGNLDKALIKADMTWDVFLTVVSVLGAKRSTLTFTLHYPDDSEFTTAEFIIDLRFSTKRSLSDLYERIMERYKIIPPKWSDLVSRYINNNITVRPGDTLRLLWLKGNIKSKIRDNNLSIKNFTTILAILNPASVQLALELEWQSSLVTIHTVNFTSRDSFGDISKGNTHDKK